MVARYYCAKLGIMKPVGYEPSQSALPFWGMKVIGAVQCMPGIRRITFSGDDEHGSRTLQLRLPQKLQQAHTCHLGAGSVQVEALLDFDIATRQALRCPAIKSSDLWW